MSPGRDFIAFSVLWGEMSYQNNIIGLNMTIQVAEFIIYFPLLIFALRTLGVVGAASAWTIRVALDYVFLRGISLRYRRTSIHAR